jgi:hypothetical protein
LRPLLTRGDADFEGFAGLHRGDAVALENARVQKRVARAVGQFDKPESPFGLEPFDNGADRRAGGYIEPGRRAKARRAAEFAQMRIVTIIVKVAAARLTEIPVSDQVGFLSESVRGPVETAEPDCSKKSPRTRVLNLPRRAHLSALGRAVRRGRFRTQKQGIVCSAFGVGAPKFPGIATWRWMIVVLNADYRGWFTRLRQTCEQEGPKVRSLDVGPGQTDKVDIEIIAQMWEPTYIAGVGASRPRSGRH